MSPIYTEIEEQAKRLPPEERARLAESLLESLVHERDAEVEAAWEHEIQERIAAYRRGKEELIDGAVVLAELANPEIEALWVEEAERRLDELEQGVVAEIPAEDVLARARAAIS
jgi:putative addiction module component (TIGR02574 family)